MSSSRTHNLIRSRNFKINNCNSLKRLTAIAYTLCQAQLIMNKSLLKRIEELFTEKLQVKTGWGRNEILAVYKEAVSEAIFEMLDT